MQFTKANISGSENQFQLLAGTAVSEGCYVGIAVIASEVVCITAYYEDQTSICGSSISSDTSSTADDLGLSLIKPMIRGKFSNFMHTLMGTFNSVLETCLSGVRVK